MNEHKTFPEDNNLLALLSPDAIEELVVERMWLAGGTTILPSGEAVGHVFFPTTAIVGVVGNSSDGRIIEVGLCGHEGAAGTAALLGGSVSALERTVQISGEVFRTRLENVQREFNKAGDLQRGILRFTQGFTHQVAMTVICSRFHTIEQRLVRWLLMRHDRLGNKIIPVTQEYIGQMLGANRTTITLAAAQLQQLGYISYTWGRIIISDREAMEAIVCECYFLEGVHQKQES